MNNTFLLILHSSGPNSQDKRAVTVYNTSAGSMPLSIL